jgi:hypothetical protein
MGVFLAAFTRAKIREDCEPGAVVNVIAPKPDRLVWIESSLGGPPRPVQQGVHRLEGLCDINPSASTRLSDSLVKVGWALPRNTRTGGRCSRRRTSRPSSSPPRCGHAEMTVGCLEARDGGRRPQAPEAARSRLQPLLRPQLSQRLRPRGPPGPPGRHPPRPAHVPPQSVLATRHQASVCELQPGPPGLSHLGPPGQLASLPQVFAGAGGGAGRLPDQHGKPLPRLVAHCGRGQRRHLSLQGPRDQRPLLRDSGGGAGGGAGHDLVFTTDRRDFAVYRIKGRRHFEVVPG